MSIRSTSNSAVQYFKIDKSTRTITAPAGFKNFGVESGENSNRVYFQCPRYVGNDLDLATLNIRVNFQNANKEKDQYIVTDVVIDGENICFSWVLSRKATAYKGSISFIICAVKTNAQGIITNEWNTTLATGAVLSGLEVEAPEISEEVTDVVNQLLDIVDTAKSDMEAATAEGMANIKTAENQAIEAVLNTPNSLMANAIKGSASGEVIAVHDVSPLEHTVNVKVQSKNLVPFPYANSNVELEGGIFTAQTDGGIAVSGAPTSLSSMVLYRGAPLATEGLITVSLTGEFENVMFYLELRSQDEIALYSIQDNKPVTINLGDIPNVAQWWVEIKRQQDNVEMNGTAYLQIEKGETATEYTPYVSPENVTLTRCGKNILPCSRGDNNYGYEVIGNSDGSVTVTGSANTTEAIYLDLSSVRSENPLKLNKNQSYSMQTWCDSGKSVYVKTNNPNGESYWSTAEQWGKTAIGAGYTDIVQVYIQSRGHELGDTSLCGTYKVQLEVGGSGTSYEPYSGTEYTPSVDGTANVTSLAPNMTLFTDTNGVNIECEYNKDSNVVIQELIERIATLENQGS